MSDTEIVIDSNRRLFLEPWQNAAGRMLVTVVPQYKDRSGEWRLAHSGLMLAPDVARQLAPLLVSMADGIERQEGGSEA